MIRALMLLLSATALAVPRVEAAEVVATCRGDGYRAVNLTLFANKPGKRLAFSPDNGFEEQSKGVFRWSKVPDGEFRIVADPDFESWDSHWIGVHTVVVRNGTRVETEFTIPEGSATLDIDFGKLPAPAQHGMNGQRVFRVDRLLDGGKVDPFFRFWIYTTPSAGKWTGELDYLSPGRFRLVAIGIDEDYESTDGPAGDFEITGPILESGKVAVTLTAAK